MQKLLAAAGHGSRREVESWIAAGRVVVNGHTAKLGDRVTLSDSVLVDGKPVVLRVETQPRVLLYHKPVGELVTRSDPEGRATVFSSLPPGRWVAVGRLDLNSSGLLLFTDSGELANRLMHPRYGLEREYSARIRGALTAAEERKLLEGIPLDGVHARLPGTQGERRDRRITPRSIATEPAETRDLEPVGAPAGGGSGDWTRTSDLRVMNPPL